ncbi:NAD(P)/FAD-dependent oxidoreductase [Actinomadura decatromicini]|uniref:NAD(P)/FAD-dependent oxidoreductase n=1 Tax=Actinomadura decatromicini TaxID=2604572 RepID=A0A5D3FSB1_9ACTN|nr:FAD-dependent oxidoreductase [Actinomadura decatromicini]TYK51009.1 NAD(P)/FAD-dependent oxidoreductase [Actinomadura decatromicini]
MSRTAVVVGSSVAGVRTAQALTAGGFDGRVLVIGAEDTEPYDKPPLSKHFLTGAWAAGRLSLLNGGPSDERIELRLGAAAEHLDVADKQVSLADGTRVPYDVCVIATGASARPSPWAARDGVHVLRTLGDGAALRRDLLRGGEVVVVGGGFVGAEVAAAARGLACRVTIVDPLLDPMARVLGPAVGPLLTGIHERHGVRTRFGAGVVAIEGTSGDLRVFLDDGTVLPAATVVVGIGAVPNDGWLRSSGLDVANGVLCDEYCRALGTRDVFAAGDVARWPHPRHTDHVRVEHWTNAVEQAACVARNIVQPDEPVPYRPVEYVWSDQYDWKIQIVGSPARTTGHTVIGDLTGDRPRAAVASTDAAGRLAAAVTLNWPRALVTCRRLLAADADFTEALAELDRLADARPAGRRP